MLLLMVFPPKNTLPYGEAEVWQLDVGQGLAVLVRTREHAMLYDAGPRFGDSDLGARVVLPSLRKLGIARLDLMLLSHADADHAGGADAIQRGLPVARLVSGDPEGLPACCRQSLAPAASNGTGTEYGFLCGNGRMRRMATRSPA